MALASLHQRSSRRSASMLALLITLAVSPLLGASNPEPRQLQSFGAQWQAKLCAKAATATTPTQPYIEFNFNGPITEFSGSLCYHFAGYNETCLPPQKRWLTPATSIELIAPGQVPAELLQGYILLVRFPWQSDALYRYPLADTTCDARRATHSN